MNKQDCGQILRLLDKLLTEATCHNRACVGHMNCDMVLTDVMEKDVPLIEVSQYMYLNKML